MVRSGDSFPVRDSSTYDFGGDHDKQAFGSGCLGWRRFFCGDRRLFLAGRSGGKIRFYWNLIGRRFDNSCLGKSGWFGWSADPGHGCNKSPRKSDSLRRPRYVSPKETRPSPQQRRPFCLEPHGGLSGVCGQLSPPCQSRDSENRVLRRTNPSILASDTVLRAELLRRGK